MTDTFVYLRSGEKVRVLYRDNKEMFGAIRVTSEYRTNDGDFDNYESDGRIVHLLLSQVFDSPPTEILSDEVVRLEKLIRETRREHVRLQRELKDAETAHAARMEKYARFSPALSYIDRFINGTVTHFVVVEYSQPTILTLEEILATKHYRSGQSKILRLYGQKKRDRVEWTMSQYVDGSGSEYLCVPCESLDEAREVAQVKFNEYIAERNPTYDIVRMAVKNGYNLPDGYAEKARLLDMKIYEGKLQNATGQHKRSHDRRVETWDTLMKDD